MDPTHYSTSKAGRVIKTQAGYFAFTPAPLPPNLPLSETLINKNSLADRSLAKLAGIGSVFPNAQLFIQPFIRQEAVLSSRIEGTQSTLTDLYSYEAFQFSLFENKSDVNEVHNYVKALNYGIERLETLPVSTRLIRELHNILMTGIRGEFLTPGEFRTSQNWIGNPGSTIETAPYIPPPLEDMKNALSDLDKYVHSDQNHPPLIRLGMIHYQFEAIHPFLDGNGRVGRLLISLLLHSWKLLPQPLLYLSGYFEEHQNTYYDLLLSVSQKGNWENWLLFLLEGIHQQANKSIQIIQELTELKRTYYMLVESERTSQRLIEVIDYLFGQPITSINQIVDNTSLGNYNAANRQMKKLLELRIVREITGSARNRLFSATEIMKITAIA